VGCPANEWHTFTPMLISLFLRRRGLNVIYLGANVPAADFEKTVKSVHGSLVLLVAQTLITAAALQQTAQALAGLRIPIGYGGRIFNLQPALQKHIPGTLLGNTIISSLDTVEKLLQSKIKATPTDALPAEYVTAHQAFVTERTQIESSVKKLVQFYSIKPEDLNTGIQFLGDNITAALQLGSMDYITHEVDWLKDLVKHHQRPMASLSDFMHIYGQAVDKHIREHGRPIKAWLNLQGQDIRQ